ncbi:MAG: hypothetical protein JWO05_2493 [Gemmatimonadetes bacterium]|nr:hypothetical protein [Gemmatimonadota bacterium]
MHGPELRLELSKRSDGGTALRWVRANGTDAFQRHQGKTALFFPLHDLAHYSVETALGMTHGFFGLIADGWELADTGGKGARGPLPAEAIVVEHLVGILDRERNLTAGQLNEHVDLLVQTKAITTGRRFSEAELAAVRELMDRVQGEWIALPPGGTMTLEFDRRQAAATIPAARSSHG